MKIGQAGWGLGLALLMGAADAMASVIYVKASAAGVNSGISWADAYTDLQAALAAATSGDEIWVAEGTYKPTTGTDVTKSFLMKGGAGLYGGFSGNESLRGERNWTAHPTILSGDIGVPGNFSDNSKTVVIGAADAAFDGFTVSGGRNTSNDYAYPAYAGGMRSGGSNIANCVFTGNLGGYGGGLFLQSGTLLVTKCTFTGNTATNTNSAYGSGGGIFVYSGATSITECVFVGNTASGYGGAVGWNGGKASVRNCAFSGNSADYGGAISSASTSVTAVNCIFSGNAATSYGGAVYKYYAAKIALTGCTISGNSAQIGGGIMGLGTINAQNCILWRNKAPIGPELCHLGETIPATTILASIVRGSGGSGPEWNRELGIDAGVNLMSDPQFADPAQPAGADGIWLTADDGWRLAGNSPCIDAGLNSNLPPADALGNPRATDGDADGQSIGDMGAYEFQLSGPPVPPALPPDPAIRFVKFDATGANNGTSWTDAFTNLQAALAGANWGDEIWVAQGTYKPTNGFDRSISFILEAGVSLYGGFTGSESTREARNWTAHPTILSGNIGISESATDNTMRVVVGAFLSGLDGFTVMGGQNTRALDLLGKGAGMVNILVSPVISNCTFTGNSCNYDGGGMFNQFASPRIENCIFSGNVCPYSDGGGMSSEDSSPIVANCVISGNSAKWYGGGLNMLRGSPEVTGCTITGNSTTFDGGGGMAIIGGTCAVTNCTIKANTASGQGGGIYFRVPAIEDKLRQTVSNCAIIGNTAGAGGGIAFDQHSLASVISCVISGNLAKIRGGGLSVSDGSPLLVNCTFFNNAANVSAGGCWSYFGNPKARNCIFQGDHAPSSPEFELYSGSYFGFVSCNVQGSGGSGALWKPAFGHDEGGNIDVDARFVRVALPAGPDEIYRTADDGLALHAGSPCIDAAESAYGPATDILGNIRPFDGNADGQDGYDIGAYEAINPLNSAASWQLYR